MNVAEALQILGLPPSASKASAEAAIRDQYRLWSNRVATAPTAAARQEAQAQVDRIGQARQVLRDWNGVPVRNSQPTTRTDPTNRSPTVPTAPGQPPKSRQPWPEPTNRPSPSPRASGIPGWNITADHRWICTAHRSIDCVLCHHPGRDKGPSPVEPTNRPSPSPRASGIPGWNITADHRWICTAHRSIDCMACFHPERDARPSTSVSMPKQKAVAILLALFLGPFTWLYTYKRDSSKFWVNMAVSIVTVGTWFSIAYFWALIGAIVRPTRFYEQYPYA